MDGVDRRQQALQRRVQALARIDAGYASGCGLATEELVAVITALFNAHDRHRVHAEPTIAPSPSTGP